MAQTLLTKAFQIDLGGGIAISGEVKTEGNAVKKPVLLLSHGVRGFKDWGFWPYVSSVFAEQGYYVVAFDFSRISVKNGNFDEASVNAAFTVSSELSDLQIIVDHIHDKRLPLADQADTAKIALFGHSRAGSGNIIFACEHPEIGAVIALNPSAHLKPQGDSLQEQTILADLEKEPARFDVPARLASFAGSALIIQGDKDSERLLEGNKALREAAPQQTFVTVAGGDHTFGISHPFADATPSLTETLEVTSSFLRTWQQP